MRARLSDLRGLLRRNVREARGVLTVLLAGRIGLTPQSFDRPKRAPIFDVTIPLTTRGLWAGIVDLQEWRPHRDSNPGFSLERAAS